MSHEYKVATIFGGTGFLGRQIVRELAALGMTVKVVTRAPERAYFLKLSGNIGQIVPIACDYSDPDCIAEAVKGSEYVVNCIGILFEKGRSSRFQQTHIDVPQTIAKACQKEGVKRLVHMSALGVAEGTSCYAKSKLEGEKIVKNSFPAATILRAGVIFGAEDNFFNMFAGLARYLPALPLIGGGHTKFQPVYVGDVADAVRAALTRPAADVEGNIYELGGPEVVTFREIYARLFHYTNRHRKLVPLPWGMAKMQATFMGLMPKPMLTRDQVESLKTDSIVDKKALTLVDLGLTATGMDHVLPGYLEHYRPGGRFGNKRRA